MVTTMYRLTGFTISDRGEPELSEKKNTAIIQHFQQPSAGSGNMYPAIGGLSSFACDVSKISKCTSQLLV